MGFVTVCCLIPFSLFGAAFVGLFFCCVCAVVGVVFCVEWSFSGCLFFLGQWFLLWVEFRRVLPFPFFDVFVVLLVLVWALFFPFVFVFLSCCSRDVLLSLLLVRFHGEPFTWHSHSLTLTHPCTRTHAHTHTHAHEREREIEGTHTHCERRPTVLSIERISVAPLSKACSLSLLFTHTQHTHRRRVWAAALAHRRPLWGEELWPQLRVGSDCARHREHHNEVCKVGAIYTGIHENPKLIVSGLLFFFFLRRV